MPNNQHTLKKAYCFQGKGLHSGAFSRLTLQPAGPDHGIRFRRTDLPSMPVIDALAENVSNTARSTTIAAGAAQAVTIEHVMSALTGLGVDNALVDLDNIEVPILDGSARPYVEAILQDGLEDQGVPRKYIQLPFSLEIKDPESKGNIVLVTEGPGERGLAAHRAGGSPFGRHYRRFPVQGPGGAARPLGRADRLRLGDRPLPHLRLLP